MRRRATVWLTSAALLCGLLALPPVHWRLLGWTRGEAFYQGRPTTYWKQECTRWRIGCDSSPSSCLPPHKDQIVTWHRSVPDWQHWFADTFGIDVRAAKIDPPLLDGTGAAVPVLIELLPTDDYSIRLLAVRGLIAAGAEGRQAVPVLRALLQGVDPHAPENLRLLPLYFGWLDLDPDAPQPSRPGTPTTLDPFDRRLAP